MTPGVADASFHLVDPGIERLSVVGLGYIGLPTAAMFAHAGLSVVGVDVNSRTVGIVNAGSAHIKENGLEEILADTVSAGRLRATLRAEPADAFIIAVPTPVQHDHSPDLSHVEAASRLIAPVLKKGDLIILESTCPVGTTRRLAGLLAAERPDLEFPDGTGAADVCLAYCPERVIPGRMLEELVENDRIVGGIMPCCAERAARLYGTFVRGQCLITDDRTAEMVKLAENTFRDVNIAFANELSVICDRLDIDVWELIRLANHHPRVKILQPGSGVGGHCIAVDPWFIVDSAAAEARLIRTAREVNDAKPEWDVQQVCETTARLQHAAPGKRESDIKTFQVVLSCVLHNKTLLRWKSSFLRYVDRQTAREVRSGKRGVVLQELRKGATEDYLATVQAGTWAKVDYRIGTSDGLLIVLYHDNGIADVSQVF